ncbi:MAG: hypothetical protein QM831_31775 [Kofleriaceae bacterium]
MTNSARWFALGLALAGCATHHDGGDDSMGSGSDTAAHLVLIVDTPTLHWNTGVADSSAVHVLEVRDADGTQTDVTDQVTFVVAPAEIGAVNAATLTPSGQMVGAGQVTATLGDSLTTSADFKVYVTDTVSGTADSSASLFDTATIDSSSQITMAYPPAGALIPPNLGEMDVHWRDTTKDVYEVQLSGGFVTLKTYVTSLGAATWTTLADARWQQLSQGAQGVDLEVRVRGIKTTSAATFIEGKETVRIAQQTVKGGVYYWNTTKAAIMRFDMSTPNVPAEQFYPQVGQSGCVGCHAVSRDGTVVAYRQEGDNMNYGNALDVSSLTRQLTNDTQQWNFAAIHPNNTDMFTTKTDGLYRTDLTTQVTVPLFKTTQISHPDVAASGDRDRRDAGHGGQRSLDVGRKDRRVRLRQGGQDRRYTAHALRADRHRVPVLPVVLAGQHVGALQPGARWQQLQQPESRDLGDEGGRLARGADPVEHGGSRRQLRLVAEVDAVYHHRRCGTGDLVHRRVATSVRRALEWRAEAAALARAVLSSARGRRHGCDRSGDSLAVPIARRGQSHCPVDRSDRRDPVTTVRAVARLQSLRRPPSPSRRP